MGLAKYAIYIGIILVVAFFFEQIMTGVYDLTLQGVAGDITAYILLVVVWIIIYIVARLFFDKKVHPKSSRYALWGGMLHISIMLGIFFANSNPILLLIFPIILGAAFWMRKKRQTTPKFAFKFHPIHPLFVDDRGGVSVFRIGKDGFLLMKFLLIRPPLPVKEILLYFYHEGIEFTFEAQHQHELLYYMGLLVRGRHFGALHQGLLERVNRVRQFFKKLGIPFTEINDYMNVLKIIYAPYFLYTPPSLTIKGLPRQFPNLSAQGTEVLIENELEEFAFAIHKLTPASSKANELYSFLETIEEPYYFQFHMNPLGKLQLDSKEEQANEQYRTTLKRMTAELENNSEFQAASYLFTQMEAPKENLEPLMDREELDRLKQVKKRLRKLQEGRTIGLWEAGFYLLGSPALAQALAVKMGVNLQTISPYTLPSLACRMGIEAGFMIDSKELSTLFPSKPILKEGVHKLEIEEAI